MPASNLLLKNARVVTPAQLLDHGSVSIRSGYVESVSSSSPSANDGTYEVIDLAGTTVFPGFIDVHIHGAVGIDTMNAAKDGLLEIARFLATQGITSWLPTLVPGSDDEYRSVAKAVAGAMISQNSLAARVLGIHYEGPFVNSFQCGALHTEHFKSYATPDDLAILAIDNPNGVKMITMAPEVGGGLALIQQLKSTDWVVSIGHTNADIELLDKAYDAGARHMTHFMNAMPQLHHRKPGPVGWGLSRDDVTFDMIADGVHLAPFTLQALLKLKSAERITLISDSIAAAGKGDGEYQIWGETISVKHGRTSNKSGSIAGSVITMLDAVKMMRSVGASEREVAQMASTNPARLLRIDQEYGSIEIGKRADLVALDDEGNVQLTIVGGEIAFRP